MKVKALIVPVVREDDPPRIEEIEDDAEGISGIIGGTPAIIVPVRLVDLPWHGYVDEEGKAKGLPANIVASQLAYRLGCLDEGIVRGPAVFLGNAEGAQYEADVPERVVAELVDMIQKVDH